MKGFWSDGISIQDLEKVTLNFLFSLSVIAILYKFLTKELTDIVMVQFSLGIGSLLVFRKIGSYFKRDSYNQQYQSQPLSPTQPVMNNEDMSGEIPVNPTQPKNY